MPRKEARSRLHELCKRAGVSLGWLAQETGLTLDALQKIASGRRQPLVTTALRIAEVLGVEVEELVKVSGDPSSESRVAEAESSTLGSASHRHRH